jgi:hypothetical protein
MFLGLSDPDPIVRGTDPRIRTKISLIPNTDYRSRRSPPHSPYESRSSQQRLADRLRPALDRLRPLSPGIVYYDDRSQARRRSRSRSPYAVHRSNCSRTRSHRRSRSAEREVFLDERSRSGHRRRHSRDRAGDLPRERRRSHREGYRRPREERRPRQGNMD